MNTRCDKIARGAVLERASRSADLILTSVYDKYSGSAKIPTHLDHISHCETTLVEYVDLLRFHYEYSL